MAPGVGRSADAARKSARKSGAPGGCRMELGGAFGLLC